MHSLGGGLFQTAVEVRLGEKRTRQLEYLVGFALLFVLSLQRLHFLTLGSGDAIANAGIDLVTLDSQIQGLWHTGNLGGNGFEGGPKSWVYASVLAHHASSAFAHLG